MKFNFTKKNLQSEKGFTLIELLVVVSIIGLLSSVVFASLNNARSKGTSTTIKSNFKNAMTEAEMSYDTAGNYSTACAAIAKMLSAITSAGATTSCLSLNNTYQSDVYLRWGASGIKGLTTPIQAWSASNVGVVTWDAQGVNSSGAFVGTDVVMSWNTAVTACSLAGGRLPTAEELGTLSLASINTSYTPPSFVKDFYWSSTTVPSTSVWAYVVYVGNGGIGYTAKNADLYVRCVR